MTFHSQVLFFGYFARTDFIHQAILTDLMTHMCQFTDICKPTVLDNRSNLGLWENLLANPVGS